MKRAAALLLLLTLGGCQVYVPLGTPRPATGQTIRAEITPRVAEELSGRLGPRYTMIEGQVLNDRADTLYMAANVGFTAEGGAYLLDNQLLQIPFTEMTGLQERRFSVWKSALFGVAVLGGVYAFSSAFGIDVASLFSPRSDRTPPDRNGGQS